jgi:hypothetical protein
VQALLRHDAESTSEESLVASRIRARSNQDFGPKTLLLLVAALTVAVLVAAFFLVM